MKSYGTNFESTVHAADELGNYQRMISERLGLEKVGEFPLRVNSETEGVRTETFFVYAHRQKGIVLVFDTYYRTMNSGSMYYAWRWVNKEHKPSLSSGCWSSYTEENKTWVGYHYAHQALERIVADLEMGGSFINPWPQVGKAAVYGVLTCGYDYKNGVTEYDLDRLQASRRTQLPQWVTDILNNNG